MRLELNPVVISLLLLGAGLYLRAVKRLSGRGYRVPRLQQASWWTGLGILTVGLLGPFAAAADELFWKHMAEHLLIADVSVPFLIVGIRTPVFLFMPPKEILVLVARTKLLRSVGGFITKPLVALPASTLILYAWHIGPLFEAATHNQVVHALQHQSFILANLILWWPALEPSKRPMPAELWKIGYLLAGRMGSILMGALFLVSNRAFYPDLYGESAARHGLTAASDQHIGAGLMMLTDVVVMLTVLAIFFTKAANEGARRDAEADATRRSAAA